MPASVNSIRHEIHYVHYSRKLIASHFSLRAGPNGKLSKKIFFKTDEHKKSDIKFKRSLRQYTGYTCSIMGKMIGNQLFLSINVTQQTRDLDSLTFAYYFAFSLQKSFFV